MHGEGVNVKLIIVVFLSQMKTNVSWAQISVTTTRCVSTSIPPTQGPSTSVTVLWGILLYWVQDYKAIVWVSKRGSDPKQTM